MIAGFGGELVSHAYLEERIAADPEAARAVDFERHVVRWWRHASKSLGPASSARAVLDIAVMPLLTLLGHQVSAMSLEPYGLRGEIRSANAILLVLPWSWPPLTAWRDAIRSGLASGAPWAFISNGRSLRIADCTRTWTRAGIEFDFDRLVVSARGITALRLLVDASIAAPVALRSRVIESDAHASRVCRSLSDGVLTALPRIASSLASGKSSRRHQETALEQSLTLVYRILFLLFAEAHSLVPMWNDIYRRGYTIESLTDRALRPSAPGLWQALQAISRLAHAGCKAGDLDVTAFNGRLFSPRHAPLVDQRRVPDDVIRDVLLSLATESTSLGKRRISYHDLGVEQLGSVYERVLEYEPAPQGVRAGIARTSTKRKSTGSFYTPRALTEFLVRHTLSPLVNGRSADQILALRICDPAMGSGAFLVAACRFLADACEHALIRDGEWLDADATAANRSTLRRNVAERCLYGVDLNPTAVQLARLSLWLTTLAADRPLTFLDHHLASGNSLIGASLSDLSAPLTRGRAKRAASLPLLDDLIANDVSMHVLPARLQLAMQPSDSLAVVKDKERTIALLMKPGGPISRFTAAADAWCAARLWTGTPPSAGVVNEWIAAAMGSATSLPEKSLRASLDRAREVAAGHHAFHWELAFPEVFLDASGHPHAGRGFDAVIGNPPWDMLRADTGSVTDRLDARSMTAATLRFCRASPAYQHQGAGHANSYQLFLERALSLVRSDGRIGLILPSGIATDHGSAALRRHVFDRTTIDAWIGFDNRARIFPIHRSVRFVVLSATNGGRTDTLRFRIGVTDPETLERKDAVSLSITRARLESWNPAHLTIPEVANGTALAILTTIADRVPVLADAAGWNVRFGRELNATDDRPHFEPRTTPPKALPIVEGKQLRPFGVDLERSAFQIPVKIAATLLDRASSFDRDRIAYRDVASATNKLTLIAAMLPRNTISTHTLFCLKSPLDERDQWCLLGLMNSLIANYLVRLQVTTHVTTALMARLPVPRPVRGSREFNRLIELSHRLAVADIDHAVDAYAELNSIAASLYSISIDEYAHVLDSFPLIPDATRTACLSVHVRATEAQNHGAKT